ncbi:uncharacterized protein [Zea mays]|uniref:uncharacterized protein n=1 Tax=Zea mays TaxID=4577 RepID=UPI0009AA8233|nr:uncharacterized protein LOC109941809 [Zea mays]|eukprot:XP_020398620.1 uncharacterized protein LOC109941809 [Zea mays]
MQSCLSFVLPTTARVSATAPSPACLPLLSASPTSDLFPPSRVRFFLRSMQPPLMAGNGSFNAFNQPPQLNSPLCDSLLFPAIKRARQPSFPKPQRSISALLLAHACTASVNAVLYTAAARRCRVSSPTRCRDATRSCRRLDVAVIRPGFLYCTPRTSPLDHLPSCLPQFCCCRILRCVYLLEADCVIEDPNSFEEDPHDHFEQGK